MSSVAELERLRIATIERSQRWMPIVIALQGAEIMALERFLEASVYRPPYSGNDKRDKRQAALGAFKNTFVETMPGSRLVNHLFSGMGAGFDYYRMIFNNLHGGHQQTHFRPEYAPAPEVSAFQEVRNRFERTLAEVSRNLELLKKAIGSESNVMPTDHARNAYAVMLLSPILYPPSAHPDAEKTELMLEWHMWLYYLSYALEQVRQDVARKRARMDPLVDLGPMFVRLKAILAKSGGAIHVPEQMSNLDRFRRDCEEGRITSNTLQVRTAPEISLAVHFSPAVKKWIAADGEGAREITKNARNYTSTYEARI